MAGRILAIDYGKARIGMALSDPLNVIAQPLEVLKVKEIGDALTRIEAIVEEKNVERIVLGLPLNMDGTEGPQVAETRAFAALLRERTGLEPVEWDERLTSRQALSSLGRQERSWRKRKEKMDAVAAQILLQSYLDSLPAS